MATFDSNPFLLFETVTDDTIYITQAMYLLDYGHAFADLTVRQQMLVLATAAMIKRNDGRGDFPES